MPMCSKCSNTFSAHFFHKCKRCSAYFCCVCVFSQIVCECLEGFDTIKTRNRFRLKHVCNSEYNRPSDNSPSDKVENWLMRMTTHAMTEIEMNLVFLELCNILKKEPNIYFPFRKIHRKIESNDPILVNNLSKVVVPTPRGLAPLGEVQHFFELLEAVSKLKGKKRNIVPIIFEVVRLMMCLGIILVLGLILYQE